MLHVLHVAAAMFLFVIGLLRSVTERLAGEFTVTTAKRHVT